MESIHSCKKSRRKSIQRWHNYVAGIITFQLRLKGPYIPIFLRHMCPPSASSPGALDTPVVVRILRLSHIGVGEYELDG